MKPMYYIGLDVHKRKISYCVKDAESTFTATRRGTATCWCARWCT
jgi:hypothetical protein